MNAKSNFPTEYAHDFTRNGGVCVAEIAPNGEMFVIARFLFRSDAMTMLRCFHNDERLLICWCETALPHKEKVLSKIYD